MRTSDHKWHEINSDEDIEVFIQKTDICRDDESFKIVSLKYENHSLSLVIESYTTGRLEMFFDGVCHFSNFRLGRSYWKYDGGCYLEFRTDLLGRTRDDRLIVWTDNHSILTNDTLFKFDSDNSVIVAYSMKYRFIGIIDDTETEQSLKEIVKENYLIEIAWDYFWKSFDSYIKEEKTEALQYGITVRDSIKPYFESYSLKHFPDSSETFIVMTIKFYSAENNKYLGYYDLIFNMNLEITDDFFVIE